MASQGGLYYKGVLTGKIWPHSPHKCCSGGGLSDSGTCKGGTVLIFWGGGAQHVIPGGGGYTIYYTIKVYNKKYTHMKNLATFATEMLFRGWSVCLRDVKLHVIVNIGHHKLTSVICCFQFNMAYFTFSVFLMEFKVFRFYVFQQGLK